MDHKDNQEHQVNQDNQEHKDNQDRKDHQEMQDNQETMDNQVNQDKQVHQEAKEKKASVQNIVPSMEEFSSKMDLVVVKKLISSNSKLFTSNFYKRILFTILDYRTMVNIFKTQQSFSLFFKTLLFHILQYFTFFLQHHKNKSLH